MRSPNYPAIGLPEAIELAQKIWAQDKRTSLTPERAVVAMGYKSLNGGSRVRLSALKKYGLLMDDGDKVRLSDRAMMVLHKPKITREYQQAIEDAIQGVELFAKLLKTHPDASEETLTSHLIVDLRFTEAGARDFVKAFISTKSLCSVSMSRKNADEQPQVMADGDEVGIASSGKVGAGQVTKQGQPRDSTDKEFPFYLLGGRRAVLRVPDHLTGEDLNLLKTQIQYSLNVLEVTSQVGTNKSVDA